MTIESFIDVIHLLLPDNSTLTGLRSVPHVSLTSLSLMIPCFDPIRVPQRPQMTSTHLALHCPSDTWIQLSHLLTFSHLLPILLAQCPQFYAPYVSVSTPHTHCKLWEGTISLLPLLYTSQTQNLAENTVGIHC